MPNFTVKNIPPELFARLKQRAESNHRSLNSEIILCIEQAVGSFRVDPQAFLATARRLREKTALYTVTEEELIKAKNEGRP